MGDEESWQRFERLALPHLDAAYNLALWLTKNGDDAQDVVQDAMIRAMRYIDGLRLDSARPWLLQIVRHTCYSWLKENRPAEKVLLDDPDDAWRDLPAPTSGEPPAIAIRKAERRQIDDAIAALPVGYREVFVLRELEDLSYNDIARIAEIPVGTVMSRLARARGLLRIALAPTARPALRTVPKSTRCGGTP
jgi:RNA polymerase sigma-70 factor (ECF subfamily)